ncbi:GNAT family N-acyltransferase [Marinimicrobium agarilyticum]|uniref:GNAT family N-acyltransferase n=1 Tax=Marinimicrobium agarilyticum TaxID=306546 RepID=UPI0004209F46|nr:lysophospholipid acyltransferase family protein [Marinimicrobium agarilyticum]
MLNIEESLNHKFPRFARSAPLLRKPTLSLLRKLVHEQAINQFLTDHRGSRGVDFIERIFDYFNFSYSVAHRERANIPAQGRVVIMANHPIGSLDGLALIHLVSQVRTDVKIIANDLLSAFEPLRDLLLPLDNMTGRAYRQSYKRILEALENEQAVIVFPAGEVSRARPSGIRDGAWRSGFLHFARKTGAPLLPVFIQAKNSWLFYSASAVFKPLATALLAHEMFNKRSAEIRFRVGEPIPARALEAKNLADKALIQRLKKHLYKLGRGKKTLFVTEKTIAHPEHPLQLQRELATADKLGATRDGQAIYLCRWEQHPTVMRELGRLREIAFRKVGEGTGRRRDLDRYDQSYQHLVLWDPNRLAIAGAYRIGATQALIASEGMDGLYTAELFELKPSLRPYLQQALELGRSFVNPDYWGKASLDYLWQGLGAYLRHHPDIRYLIGPVSLSADYPKPLQDWLVVYHQRYYAKPENLASARHPHLIDPESRMALNGAFANLSRHEAHDQLQTTFKTAGHSLPVLFKHYPALYEDDGYHLLAFSVDSDFGECLDGLFLADLSKMKANKRKRYIGDA